MERPKSWCTKTYLKRVKSTEIIVKRKSVESRCALRPETRMPAAEESDLLVETPKREVRVVTPDSAVRVLGSPKRRSYRSVRRIDF